MLFLKGNFSEKHQQSRMDYKKQRKYRIMHAEPESNGRNVPLSSLSGKQKKLRCTQPWLRAQKLLTWSKHERTTTTAADIVRSSRFLCKVPPKLANRSSYFYSIDLRTNETETWREFVLHSTRFRDVFNGQNLNAPLE